MAKNGAGPLISRRSPRQDRLQVEAILEATPDAVQLLDERGMITQINPAGLALLEADPEEVFGRSALEFIKPAHHGAFEALLARVFHGESVEAECEIVTRSGNPRWATVRVVPLREHGRISAALAITRDITVHKNTEQALQESEEYFRLLVENLGDIVVLVSPDGTILYISGMSEPVLGFAPEQLIGESGWDYVHPDDVALLQARAAARLAGDDSPLVSEVRMRHSDGSWRDIQLRARLYPGGRYGEPALLITMRDITEAKRTEADLKRTQEQLLHIQKLEAVGRLAGGVAHDFNNLLTAINGHADLLLEHITDNPDARSELEEIKHGVKRAAALTRQLLAFSRKQVMQPVVLDVNAVVNDMRRLLERLIGENIELVTRACGEHATVRADRGQVEQVLMNLVVNARDAMPRGGRVTVTTDIVDVTPARPHSSGAKPGRYVRLVVADNGHGMSQAVLDHIFEPFYTTKEVGKGTGLGLATVYGIVKQSDGYLDVRTAPDEGTTLEILLPHVTGEVNDGVPPGRPAENGASAGRILIVEDEKSVRDVACRVLRRAGFEVITARDGMEALEVGGARLHEVDLVVTDVIMPRLNGPDLVQQLRRLRPDIRVLFTSGYTDDAVFPQGTGSLAIGFLEKPFTPAALIDAVRKAMGAGMGAGGGPTCTFE